MTAAGQRCEDHGRRRGGGGRWRSRGPAGGGRRSSRVARALEQAALVVNGQWAQQVRYLILIHVILHFGPSAPGARGRTPANEFFPGTAWRQLNLLFVRAYSVFLVPTAMCLTGSWLREDSVAFSCREFASVRVRQCFLTHSSRPPESTSTVRGCWFSGSDCALVSKSLGSVACAISAK